MAATLFEMAQRASVRNVMDVFDIGELPYEVVRPILKNITNPAQLRKIEQNSPHIAEDDSELWEAFIRRDILQAETKLRTTRPKNPSSWWKVYAKLKREDEAQTQAAEARLKAALNAHKVDKGSKQTNIVRAVIPSGEKRPAWNSAGPRDKPFGSQALKNAKTGTDQMTVIKRQTAQRQAGRSVAQSIPMHQLQQLKGKVAEAPAHMVRRYAQQPGPTRPSPMVPQTQAYRPVFASKVQTVADRALASAITQTKQEQEARERRLLALTSGSKPRPSPTTSARRSSPAPAPPRRPSPVHTSSASTLVRKRPAYDPFLPAKKRRP
ncbi:hypothetical protein E4T42_00881 [Aureobasidium subglaciale]|uniref:Elongin-A n=1 Tax=Aureobasidium subglaciale (strain EXF-2481) TaxID=1043005 RepID=A0A074Z0J5_AURSE|nr:uncharacterized protein AUEXF2481DRAFT_85447 [Aureobasidium subglaciale EXF-2481]KAI5211414.1 hypothetical protein E4T38_01425 [Aureobasidium subglaciale]KAI5229622.1 hypothetical protein E4T40_01426 [Aureobasidium subglaciale]KAI5233500.1 hypothetical protein E4T41_01423 [Aureobasidium subglaciale]KAI5257425.1 hypothetical protein E4T42_00881 [Aureobasidium subglaciale]KAI5266689.1 hypothetical protein E4T46_01425 [Aureobasidium subglaciale]